MIVSSRLLVPHKIDAKCRDHFLQDFPLLNPPNCLEARFRPTSHSRHRHQFRVQDREWQTSCPLHIKESRSRPPSSASRLMSSLCSISPASIHRAGRRRPGNKWTGDWYF